MRFSLMMIALFSTLALGRYAGAQDKDKVKANEADETAHRIRLVARRFLQQEVEYLGSVPFDPAVTRAVRRQEPVVTAFPQSPAAAAYRGLAGRLWVAPDPDPKFRTPHAPQRLEA